MAPKRRAASLAAAGEGQPSQKKAAGVSKPRKEAHKAKAADVKPPGPEVDYPEPRECLFDAQIDLAATIAANAAALHGDTALERFLQAWRRFAEGQTDSDGRVSVRVVAGFVEGERAIGEEAAKLTWGEGEAGTSDSAGKRGLAERVQLRCKAIGDLMGGQLGRGHNCLRDPPNCSPESVKVALRTLSVEDATLYILDSYAQQQNAALRDLSPAEDEAGGKRVPVEGEAVGGALPTNWTDQLAQWEAEGVGEAVRFERMGETVSRCLRGLPVFVMRNGGQYVSTTHLKYVLGLEKKPYELFRILREHNRASGRPEEAADVDWNRFHELLDGKIYTAGPGVPRTLNCGETAAEWQERRGRDAREAHDQRKLLQEEGIVVRPDGRPLGSADMGPGKAMVEALSGLASSPEELAQSIVRSARARGADPINATWRAHQQLAAVTSDGLAADRFRVTAVELLSKQLSENVEQGPPEEAFEEMGRRLVAAKLRKPEAFDDPAGVAWDGGKQVRSFGVGEKREPKRVVPVPVAPAKAEDAEEVEEAEEEDAVWQGVDESKLDAGGDDVDGPDPEEADDECTVGIDWEQWYWDREEFVPNAPVPIRQLGEISRFWCEFGVPDQVVVMQHNYRSDYERKFEGRHNLWTFKVLSNIMPVSRFIKSAPSSETFVAADLAKEALSELGPDSGFDRSIAIAALAHSMGAPVDKDTVHATGSDLISLARANVARKVALALAKETGKGPATTAAATGGGGADDRAPSPNLVEVYRHSLVTVGRSKSARVTEAAVDAEKKRWQRGTSEWGRGASE